MKKMAIILAIMAFLGFVNPTFAVSAVKLPTPTTPVASVSATPTPLITESTDLTVPTVKKGKLETLIENQKVEGWFGVNFLKIAIRKAVNEGVSPNTIVVLFLFPLVAGLVAFSRQVVGVSGFGIITPALLSVAFLSTGGLAGLVLLLFIMLVATASRMAIKKVKVPYLPKLAILIWMICLAVLGLLMFSPRLGLDRLIGVGIFPILLFVLLAETFIEAQITRTLKTSMMMTAETIVLALIAYEVMSASWVQTQVLLHPEIAVILILAIDYLIGRYEGLRLMEVWRFRKMLKK
jgi:hypothetical protein